MDKGQAFGQKCARRYVPPMRWDVFADMGVGGAGAAAEAPWRHGLLKAPPGAPWGCRWGGLNTAMGHLKGAAGVQLRGGGGGGLVVHRIVHNCWSSAILLAKKGDYDMSLKSFSL